MLEVYKFYYFTSLVHPKMGKRGQESGATLSTLGILVIVPCHRVHSIRVSFIYAAKCPHVSNTSNDKRLF